MPYNRQIPDAPIAGSMLPRVEAADLKSQDILVLTQPGNPIGQKNKGLELGVLFNSDLFKFAGLYNSLIKSNILEYTGALAPTNVGNSWTEVCYLNIDPRLDVEFHVWGTSGYAYQSQGSEQTAFSYGLRARVRQTYMPDDIDRDLIATYSCGDRHEIVGDGSNQVIQPVKPTYNVVFNCLPFDYTDYLALSRHPTKKVSLYLSGGAFASPYQCHQPDSYSLNIQATIYPSKYVSDILKATTP